MGRKIMKHEHFHHHPHDGHHHHGPGHNSDSADRMHSHPHGDGGGEQAAELHALCASFIDGFRQASDKNSYLRIAGIPYKRTGKDGLAMHLVDAAIVSNWQIGTASPAFGTRELVYMPYPGQLIGSRETMTFTYVSLTQRADVDLRYILHRRHQHRHETAETATGAP
jgi:hypothetical protein